MKTRRQKAHDNGLWAEKLAALCLACKGYRILKLRYKTPVGEIDVVAQKGRVLVMVEVKRRGTLDGAIESILPKGQKRIENAARYFLSGHPWLAECDMRFDAFVVAGLFRWRHLDNAWQGRT